MSRGFSLIEVLVAMTIVVVAVAGLAQSVGVAARANRTARSTTIAVLLASQKMEQLRALAWSIDPAGAAISDPALGLSPPGTLTANTGGYCEFLDAAGNTLAAGLLPPPGTIYTRRWSIDPLPSNPYNTLVLQVIVTRSPSGAPRSPDDVRLASVRTRTAQ
jgi:prepilin-type N-terminal cleavage/methylation domain-containing protein